MQTLQWPLSDNSSMHRRLEGRCGSEALWLTGGVRAASTEEYSTIWRGFWPTFVPTRTKHANAIRAPIQNMMTSSNGHIFRVTGHLCGEFTGPHKGQWHGALMISLIRVWINDWVNNREAGDLRRYRAHYDVIVMKGKGSLSIHVLSLQCRHNEHDGVSNHRRIDCLLKHLFMRRSKKISCPVK